MRVCAAAKSKLATSRGCVINLASMLSFFGAPRAPAYSASKGGIAQLTKSLAAAWASDGIRVNAVAPGAVWTEIHLDPERPARVGAQTPLGRAGEPAEIAGAVAWLLSDDASYTTGAILRVAGGR
jgi:NAD(P)-dependent dehydrogenase (short-subunit alcohol dehydrogenase family)